MAKGLGITALVLLLLSFPIPILGNYITLLALAVAAGAALSGEVPFTVATTVLSGIKLFLLSPTWHIAMFGAEYMKAMSNTPSDRQYGDAATRQLTNDSTAAMAHSNAGVLVLTVAFLAAPIVCLVVRRVLMVSQTPEVAS